MNTRPLRRSQLLTFAAALIAASIAFGRDAAGGPEPRLMATAVTEFTDSGRQQQSASAGAPVYFATHPLGYKARGEAVREPSLSEQEIGPLLAAAAAKNGFLPGTDAHPPQIALVYMWGSHFSIDTDVVPASDDQLIRNMLDRASLAGGRKFATDLAKAYRDSDNIGQAGPGVITALPEQFQGAQIGAARGMVQMNSTMDPLRLFMMRSPKHQQLVEHASRNLYFVVISAYDYASLGQKQQRLLWRTSLTIAAQRTSQKQALPALLQFGAPYLGRETPEAEVARIGVAR